LFAATFSGAAVRVRFSDHTLEVAAQPAPAWGEIMKRSVDDDGDRPMGYDRPTRA
jgi:hypothetical protein